MARRRPSTGIDLGTEFFQGEHDLVKHFFIQCAHAFPFGHVDFAGIVGPATQDLDLLLSRQLRIRKYLLGALINIGWVQQRLLKSFAISHPIPP